MAFRVLFVCTANICRSAMAERLLLAELAAGLPIEVSSAGLQALDGHEMDSAAAAALRELGGDADGHVAHQLDVRQLTDSDLVLTATSRQRSEVVALAPTRFRRIFTLREFARLGAGFGPVDVVTEDGLQQRVRDVAGRRGVASPPAPGEDEIGDPFGAPWSQMQACAAMIDTGIHGVVAALGLPAS